MPQMVVKSILRENGFSIGFKKRPKEALLKTNKKPFCDKILKRTVGLGPNKQYQTGNEDKKNNPKIN
ncbi:hypothetical protein FFWV33_01045 [Flavobacterium faecale]|uniref:Uncharacterized protein n=1 Tax=Flavobacterium faecale TaxID=1355330 RepID=A0A2S1L8X9_9FLAO|nr:hypothetical protein FFWV33_01045 [Flavobacterium faecale]